MDVTAADVLTALNDALRKAGIELRFAELKDPVRRKIDRYRLTRTIDPAHFFPTLEDAVAAYRERTGTDWIGPTSPPGALIPPG